MSYKEKLEKLREVQREASSQAEAKRKADAEQLIERATKLREHIEAQDPNTVGLVIKHEGARLTLTHGNSPAFVVIDASANDYRVRTMAPPRPGKGIPIHKEVQGSRQTLTTPEDVDGYLLNFLESVKA